MEARATIAYVSSLCIYGTIGWVLSFINLPSEVVVLCRGLLGSLFLAVVVFALRKRFDAALVRSKLALLVVSGLCLGLKSPCSLMRPQLPLSSCWAWCTRGSRIAFGFLRSAR